MDFDIIAAIISGIVATGVMTALMYMGLGMMPSKMPMNILQLMGTMMTRSTAMVYGLGTMMHFGAGIIFAIIHVALYQAFGIESNLFLWGILFGAAHWVIASMGMGMMGTMHPMIRNGEMMAPGFFVRNLPMMSVMGFFIVHIVFGLVNGAVYEAIR